MKRNNTQLRAGLLCTLAQAQRLKELGVSQVSLFYISDCEGDNILSYEEFVDVCKEGVLERDTQGMSQFSYSEEDLTRVAAQNLEVILNDEQSDMVAAFTVAELSSLIGVGTKGAELLWQRVLDKINGAAPLTDFYKADVLAAFVIECIESGVIVISKTSTDEKK